MLKFLPFSVYGWQPNLFLSLPTRKRTTMHVHFIAIGGSAMHNLAIALHLKGIKVTGSDDEIFEPSKSRLLQHGLLPETNGWKPEAVTAVIDAVILGMHARADNPELIRAKQLGLRIYSYPEFLYEQTRNKKRVVIAGSHGKTTTTSMIMHVLKTLGKPFDYMVGANVEGFDTMVGLSHDAPVAIFEGDEYLSSPIDLRPKFIHYKPHIGLITGIAWDHINVFPTFGQYVEQFDLFASMIEDDGTLVYFEGDDQLVSVVQKYKNRVELIPYGAFTSSVERGTTYAEAEGKRTELKIFGAHNMQNLAGAMAVCKKLDVCEADFLGAIASFRGSARRLEVIAKNDVCTVFFDFAHSPSKLKATTNAVKEQYPQRKLVAVMELHTFSSLKKDFLPQYRGSMEKADVAFVYFDPHTIEHKRLDPITAHDVAEAFGDKQVQVFTNSDELFELLVSMNWHQSNLLIMTSGNFSGKITKNES
jgi:UDP-N-acetylmuramate: L-alanyl-gamma-D-glutamyl-meso-diaminopimelate ligase